MGKKKPGECAVTEQVILDPLAPWLILWIVAGLALVFVGLAVWRRIRLIPFDVTFSGAQVDKHLEETLLDELEGILVWAVEGNA